MFTDERSPFQPPRRTPTGLLVAIVLSVAAATAIRWSASDQTSLQKPAARGVPNTAVAPDPLPPFSRAPVDRQAPAPRPAVAREARPPTMTIYLCKGYAGESFWSDTLCS
jgi:hypothetical protein